MTATGDAQMTSKPGQDGSGKYLTFALSKERYGLEILKVQEIIGVPNITKVPKCPSYIKGVINLRGKIIPVIDLRLKFKIDSIPYDEKTCIIVVTMQKSDQKISVGVIVDTVLEVVNFEPKHVEPAPDYGATLDTKFIIGLGRKENEIVNILIDIEKILSDGDAAALVNAAAQ